ncbi:MAG TPA: hypothetical protein VFK04_13010 [Gemmatimonadaceae bacterium]|nr:hypothetical protein [Gemmatimonadaceae bacterium]
MTLEWADGFRYGGVGKYEDVGNPFGSTNFQAGRGSDNGLDDYGLTVGHFGAAWAGKIVSATPAKVAGIRGHFSFSQTVRLFEFRDAAVCHVYVEVDYATFVVTVKRGDGTVLGTSAPVTSMTGEEFYLEAKVVVSDAAGSVEVRYYGTPVLSVSGVDTRNGGTATIDRVRAGSIAGTETVGFDDFYIDTQDFHAVASVGAVPGKTPRVIDLDNVAAGDLTAWAATGAGGVNWDAVSDDATSDGDTSYVASSVVGNKDLYQLTNLPAGVSNILAVVQWGIARKDDATGRQYALTVRSGATDSDSGAKNLTNSYAPSYRVLEVDPDTGAAWTAAAVNALQAGVKVVA